MSLMKYLYLYYLNLRLWALRRRLRRLRPQAPVYRTRPERSVFQPEDFEIQRLLLDWIKVGLLAASLVSFWLIFGLRLTEPLQITLPPLPQPVSSPSPCDNGWSPSHTPTFDPSAAISRTLPQRRAAR
jgi:hypothetical protein